MIAILPSRKAWSRLHLWLGLASGLIFALVCVSGALIAFTEETLNVVNARHLAVQERSAPRASIDSVLAGYAKIHPAEKVMVVNQYRASNRTIDFFSAQLKPGTDDEYENYKMVYADPYTGEILHVDRHTLMIIVLVVFFHTTLMLGHFGHEVIRWSTLVFAIQLVSGIAIWWPRNRAAWKSSFTFLWSAGPKRRLFDAHRVLGIWLSAALLLMVGTALVMSFSWFAKPVVALFGGEPSLVHGHDEEHPVERREEGTPVAYDVLFDRIWAANPRSNQVTLTMPYHDSIAKLAVRVHDRETFLNFAVGSPSEIDRMDASFDNSPEAQAEARNARIYAINLLLHMGFWGGSITKVLYFLIGLAGASLPVTGFLLWRSRRRRSKGNEGAQA